MKNGYFQLVCSSTGTALKIFAPKDGGANVFIRDIMDYLNHHIITFDSAELNKGLQDARISGMDEYSFPINRDNLPEIRESYRLSVTPNKMTAIVRFYPPSVKGGRMSAEELLSDLALKKITTGIRTEEIQKFFGSPEYCTDFVAAQGKIPRIGKDARIEYYFETNLKARPTLNDDGTVDFFHLNTIAHCNKGDVLARLFPEDPGDPGLSVYGEKVKPREVKKEVLKFGKNISLSEDNQILTADVDGHVTLVEGKVFVSNILEVENVDSSTGNIDYDGSVLVSGNVCTNFEVKAKGNIEVKGVVEGAYLESGGDIIITRGVNGTSKGSIQAKGNIVAKFIENANITAGGYVETEAILHSDIYAGTEILVTGKKGFITGGKVSARNLLQVKTLGSSMGAATIVEVGVDPGLKARMQQMQRKIAESNKAIVEIYPILSAMTKKLVQGEKLRPEQVKTLRELMQREEEYKQKIEEDTKAYKVLQKMMDESTMSSIEVKGTVYPGTKICISETSMVVKTAMSYCRFVKEQGEIVMMPL